MKTEDLQKEVMMNKIIVKPLHGFTICLDWLASQVQSLKEFYYWSKMSSQIILPLTCMPEIKNAFSKNSLQRETQYLVTALRPNEQICPGLQVNVSDSRSLS